MELREKRALTYDFDAVNVSGLDYGYFFINCPVKTRSLNLTQTVIRGELEKIKSHPPSKNELEKAKICCLEAYFGQLIILTNCPACLPMMRSTLKAKTPSQTTLTR